MSRYDGVEFITFTRRDGELDSAEVHFHTAARLNRDFPMPKLNLGNVWLDRLDTVRAAEWFRAALRTRRGYAEAYASLGAIYISRGRTDSALVYLDSALTIEPSHVNATLNMALIRLQERSTQAAEMLVRNVVHAGTDSANLEFVLGEIALAKGQTAEAQNHYRSALGLQARMQLARERLESIVGRRR